MVENPLMVLPASLFFCLPACLPACLLACFVIGPPFVCANFIPRSNQAKRKKNCARFREREREKYEFIDRVFNNFNMDPFVGNRRSSSIVNRRLLSTDDQLKSKHLEHNHNHHHQQQRGPTCFTRLLNQLLLLLLLTKSPFFF